MFKEQYRKINESIVPEEQVVQKVKGFQRKSRKNFGLYKAAAVLLGVIVVASTIPVLASNVEPFYEMMYAISPVIAQNSVSVRKSCESNGILMEVISANIEENTADIYIAMRDLTGDRIDASMDLNDSYLIKSKYDTMATCQLMEYEEDTKTAIFKIHIEQKEGKDIKKEKVTFSVKNFMSDKKEYSKIELIDEIRIEEVETTTQYLTGFSGNFSRREGKEENFIKPVQKIETDVEGMWISGYGYVEDEFHVQVAIQNKLQTDTHGEVYLKKEGEEALESDCVKSFCIGTGEDRIDYQEYVFDISREEIGSYQVYGSFVTSGKYTDGDWQVVFNVE